MTKEVLLSLKGLQYETEENNQEIEVITPAEYYSKNGTHYIIYQEVAEESMEPIKNVIKFRENYLEVTKSGALHVHMVFEAKKKNIANYGTPYGEIIVGVDTEKVILTQEEEHIQVRVKYALDINYVPMAECNIYIDVRARGTGELRLTP